MNKQLKIFTNGFIKENPLLVLNIGLCSSLGVTTSIFNGLGMGLGMTFVLLMSEIVISIFRKFIPAAIRLPVFIIIIAAFTTIVQLVLQAYVEALYSALGVFLPLIVVNCIIMGRVEAFASKNNTGNSILDALGMGIGYTLVLVFISAIRELLGGGTLMAGTAFQVTVIPEEYRIGLFNSAPGGFMVFGILAAFVQCCKQAKAGAELKKENQKLDKKIIEKNSAEKTESVKPVAAPKPAENVKPVETVKTAENVKPVEAEKPVETGEKPAENNSEKGAE